MIRFGVFARNLYLSKPMREALENFITNDAEVSPGQLRQKGDWLYLTYLRVVKVKNFDATMFELSESEVDTIRVSAFRFKKNKLLISGGKSEVKEIKALFDALALQLSGAATGDETINYDDYYKLDEPEVDLNNILQAYESRGTLESVRKLRMKDVEVKLGSIRNCIIDTDDYGGVRKLLSDVNNTVVGLEMALREPEKTYLYVDVEGQVKVATASVDDEMDVEKMAVDVAAEL